MPTELFFQPRETLLRSNSEGDIRLTINDDGEFSFAKFVDGQFQDIKSRQIALSTGGLCTVASDADRELTDDETSCAVLVFAEQTDVRHFWLSKNLTDAIVSSDVTDDDGNVISGIQHQSIPVVYRAINGCGHDINISMTEDGSSITIPTGKQVSFGVLAYLSALKIIAVSDFPYSPS